MEFILCYIPIKFHPHLISDRQPVVQQVKSCFEDVTALYREESQRIDTKVDALLQIQRERLQLERERLEFEREKAGIPGALSTSTANV